LKTPAPAATAVAAPWSAPVEPSRAKKTRAAEEAQGGRCRSAPLPAYAVPLPPGEAFNENNVAHYANNRAGYKKLRTLVETTGDSKRDSAKLTGVLSVEQVARLDGGLIKRVQRFAAALLPTISSEDFQPGSALTHRPGKVPPSLIETIDTQEKAIAWGKRIETCRKDHRPMQSLHWHTGWQGSRSSQYTLTVKKLEVEALRTLAGKLDELRYLPQRIFPRISQEVLLDQRKRDAVLPALLALHPDFPLHVVIGEALLEKQEIIQALPVPYLVKMRSKIPSGSRPFLTVEAVTAIEAAAQAAARPADGAGPKRSSQALLLGVDPTQSSYPWREVRSPLGVDFGC
jgi:hypothetical protein